MAGSSDICECGSGLPFSRCHGDPSKPYARAQALREAESIAALFPAVRASGAAVEPFLEEVAAAYPAEDDVTDGVLEQGLALLDASERRRIIDSWARPYADRWTSLTTTAGDVAAAERALLVGTLRIGIAERQPTPPELVGLLDQGALRRSPYAALALVLPGTFVWSIDEARAAEVAQRGRRKWRQGVEAVQQVAHVLISFEHIRRTRVLAGRLARELPMEDLPTASELLGKTCARIEDAADAARTAAAALLVRSVEELRIASSRRYSTSLN